jgi:hypothetical protein
MSSEYAADLNSVVQKYIMNPGRQINLAATVISFWYIGAFILGVFLLAVSIGVMVFKSSYATGQKTKRPFIVLAWIGFAMILFAIWATISSFYAVVGKINNNIKVKRECSLFQFENPANVINILASEASKDDQIAALVAKETRLESIATYDDEYSGIPDASTNSRYSRSLINDSKSARDSLLTSVGSIRSNPGLENSRELSRQIASATTAPSASKLAEKIYKEFKETIEKNVDSVTVSASELNEQSQKFIKENLTAIAQTYSDSDKLLPEVTKLLDKHILNPSSSRTKEQLSLRKDFHEILKGIYESLSSE